MTEEHKTKVSVNVEFVVPIFILFFLFWQQSGWYRIYCALGVQKACELIAHEKEYSEIKDK